MKKLSVLQRLAEAGIIAVVRGASSEEAMKASHALIKGGIKGVELTFSVPNAEKIIQELSEEFSEQSEVIIGAGTVLDVTTARLAIMAGAEYIVSPCFDRQTAELCNLYQIPYMPGCMTITEMQTALKAGVDIVKLFPGSVYGPEVISAFKAPLPQLNIMPTGGVNLENMGDWFKAGAIAVGIGGSLLAPAAAGDFEKIVQAANAYSRKLQEIRGI